MQQRGNHHRLQNVRLLYCETQPWAFTRAKAVNHETRSDKSSSSQAVTDTVGAMQLGADGILEDE
mgnify:CR=1 FL=1